MQRKDTYTLLEISNWGDNKEVVLPNIQRGFVWKPSQIENLWDSLLRGYPVGAFVLSPKENGGYEMLDGQQRATAIGLGFAKGTFRNTHYKVFVDLETPPTNDNIGRAYYFRVITPSHPWGYHKKDNKEPLDADKKRKAREKYLEQCGVKDVFDASQFDKLFPYDAKLPIPFHLFLTSESIEVCKKSVEDWLESSGILQSRLDEVIAIKEELATKPKSKNTLPELVDLEMIMKRVEVIYKQTQRILNEETAQRIPALYLSVDEIDNRKEDKIEHEILSEVSSTPKQSEIITEEDIDDIDPVENLFIRLNEGGTPLRGEDLNYSLLKSKIDLKLQELIEESCKGIIRPARFITIAFRLFQHVNNIDSKDGLSLKVKVKPFQRAINSKVNKKSFVSFLKQLLTDKTYDGLTVLEYAVSRLSYSNECEYGLPHIMVNSFADKAPEIMFLYLFRLIGAGDRFSFNTEEHRKMLGIITCFAWLGKSKKQRNYNKLLSSVWPAVKELKQEQFWTIIAIQRAQLDESFRELPSWRQLLSIRNSIFLSKAIKSDTSIIQKLKLSSFKNYIGFIEEILKNKEVILFAQRNFIDVTVTNELLELDDTDVPFDWDHISPVSYVGRNNIPKILKDWYESNGNKRAWPYALNRMDQNEPPAKKLSPMINHVNDGNNKYPKLWQEIINDNPQLFKPANKIDLNRAVRKWSFCSKEWLIHDKKYLVISGKQDWYFVYELIAKRNFELINEWYKELRIDTLIPNSKPQKDRFEEVFNQSTWSNSCWKSSNKETYTFINEILGDSAAKSWVSKEFSIENNCYYFFLVRNNRVENIIGRNGIVFGLFKSNNSISNSLFRVNEVNKQFDNTDKKTFVNHSITLSSQEEVSYKYLVNNISSWLHEYPIKRFSKPLQEQFLNTIKANFKK